MRKFIFTAISVMLGFAAPAAAQQPPPPKLLVTIRISGLTSDLFGEYRQQFTGGFAELASGAVFVNGSATTSGPGIGDVMKSSPSASRYVTVAGEHGAGGSSADQRWFWTGTSFETDRPAAVPPVVAKVNAAIAGALTQPRPPLEPSAFCQSKQGRVRFGRAAGEAGALATSPELDGDTLALAAGFIDQMQLGRRSDADTVSVDLSATGNVAKAYGARGEEMCLQLAELDREIGDFLALLDSRGIDYAVALEGEGAGRVPVLLWRPGFRGATLQAPVNDDDVTATLAALVAVPPPPAGHCLEGTPAFCPQR